MQILKFLKWGKGVRSSATVTAGSYDNIFSENKILTISETDDVFGDSSRIITAEFRSLSSLSMDSFIRGVTPPGKSEYRVSFFHLRTREISLGT